ncbi:homoserine dehydrogenase [Paenibacillus aurantius]|uniref:Homoserine dehydrogenase n=1 Tax=Paenibacillus aurantius TaxID=2918900 RepID=A0AA96L9P5_9BACL|nr:homoserine dehydrogenase [Paenibacillus aurantius]WNQ09606.1 homoserine dehydrogenase [Paenibacillus aurantius]
MRQIRIVLTGFGTVGREFIRLIKEKSERIKENYNLELRLVAVGGRDGFIGSEEGLRLDSLSEARPGSQSLADYARNFHMPLTTRYGKADVLVEAAPTDVERGEPGFTHIMTAFRNRMDVIAISKGALVARYDTVFEAAKANKVRVKYSGATAAALPTKDIGEISLAGSEIVGIEGILNGTTNYILTRMQEDGLSFEEALLTAQQKGIAETNPDLDVKGIDSACKILLLSNDLLGTHYSLKDLSIQGIDQVTKEQIAGAKGRGMKYKLLARAHKQEGNVHISIAPMEIGPGHLLAAVDDTNKGIVFQTDTMGEVCVLGGSSSPRGAAAAALKDLINLYRDH